MKNRKRILAAILTAIMTISILPANSFASEAGENDTAEAAVEAVSVSDEEQEVESTVEDISEETASETEEEPSVIDEAEEDSEPETTEEVETVIEEEDFAAEEAEETVEADEVVETVEDDIETVDTESEGPRTLKAEGKDYIVTVTYNDSALLPNDVKIDVEEIRENARKYDTYCDDALEAVQKENDEAEEINYIRLFDITLVDGEGHKVQPETAVDVQIRLKDVDTVEDNTQIVHFAGKEEKPEVIEPAIENDTVAFEAEGFSIYAVVTTGEYARLTVSFVKSESDTTTMYVKQKDITDGKLNQVLYDPGVPVQEGKKFLGWTDNENWTSLSVEEVEDAAKTIDDIRDEVTTTLNNSISDGDSVTYYAMMVNCFELYYQDEYNNTFKTENVLSTSNSGKTTVECPYTLTGGSATESFIGWKVMGTESPVYKNGDPITITEDTTLVPKVGQGKWIYFDENDGGSGGGADYTRPVFVPAGELATNYKPADPTRPGYTFAGWYKGTEDNAQKYNFDTDLEEFPAAVTLYAHWTPNTHASYKVIIWKQKVTDDKNAADADKTYDYFESHTVEEVATDTPITAETLSQYLSYGNEELGVTDLEHGSYGFKTPARFVIENGSGADKNGVSADGSTIVNVYYDRTLLSIRFTGTSGGSISYIPTGNGSNVYGRVNGEYVPLTTTVSNKRIVWTRVSGTLAVPESFTQVLYSSKSGSSNLIYSDQLANVSGLYYYGSKLIDQEVGTTATQASIGNSSTRYYLYTTDSRQFGNYCQLKWTIAGDYSYTYNGEPYEGQLYKQTSEIIYTGLYGQSFKDADPSYTWIMPDSTHHWEHVSYLDAFTGNLYGHTNVGGTPNTIAIEKSDDTSNIITLVIWEQNTDLSGYTKAASVMYSCVSTDGFNITERVQGMTPSGYRWSTSESMPSTWNSAATMSSNTDGVNAQGYTNVKRGSNTVLHVKNDRVTNDIVFMYGSQEVKRTEGIAYGVSLADYQNTTPDASEINIPEHQYFAGWYDNPEGVGDPYDWSEKMPLGNKLIYAITKPVQYHVIVEMDGGEVQNQSTNFRVSYGTTIADTNFMQATKTVDGTNYSLVGYYTDEAFTDLWNFSSKVTADSLWYTYTGPDDQMRETYGDVGRDQTVGIFKLFARWRNDDILKQGGLNIRYRNPDASDNLYVDSMHYADLSDVIAAQAPEEAVWPKDKRFDGWQLTEGKVYQPGDVFVADSDDAVIESGKYWITLTAVYVDKEDRTPTHVTWYKNYAEDGVYGYYHTDDDYSINAGINIYGPPTRTGYEFLGWAKATEKESADDDPVTHIDATTPNFLAFKEGKFYLVENGTTTDKVVTQIAADEVLPYEALYAVWKKDQFLIYHSSTGQTEHVDMPESGKFDITEKVASNKLYGGYYEYNETDSAKKGAAITTNPGTSMVPEKDHIYYLKEVDAKYLRPAVYLTWSEIHGGLIRNLYGFVDIDTQDDYTDAGLDIGGEEFPIWGEGKLTDGTITVTKQGEGRENDTLTALSLFTIDNAVFGYTDLTSKISGGARLLINGYYKTKDGVKVTGYKTRVIQFAANDPAYGAPVFTGWNSNGNTVCGLASVKPSYTLVSRSLTAGKFTLMRSLSINVPADKLEYTITKVYDSGVDLQVVEEGDHTGEITYAEKSGYYFAGWYKDGAFTEPADFSDINSDLTVYAKYVKASDISASFSRKSSKSGTTTFNAVVAVKGKSDLADVSVMVNGKNASVLGNASVKKTGSGKNVKYTTQYKGTAAVSGLSLISSFTASVSWTTADGTAVAGPAYKCTYILGLVTVK